MASIVSIIYIWQLVHLQPHTYFILVSIILQYDLAMDQTNMIEQLWHFHKFSSTLARYSFRIP